MSRETNTALRARIVALAAAGGLSYSDIAAVCGVSRGAVAGHLHRHRHPELTTRASRWGVAAPVVGLGFGVVGAAR